MGYFLGVDIGTTYTAAAVVESGRAEVVTLGNRTPTVPTVIYLGPDEELLVGEAANRRAITDPERIARQFKRRVGDPTPVMVGGSPLSPQALMARVLRWVVDRVTEQQGQPPDHVALTHPANWGRYKLELVEQALRLSDLERWTTISEPEAAAVYYSSIERVGDGDVVAVYDLGGGTFDAAVLRQAEDRFHLLGTPEGIEHLGGIDVDEAVFSHVAGSLSGFDDLDPDDTAVLTAVARLRQDCTEAKEALSVDHECTIPVLIPGLHSEVTVTRAQLEGMLAPWLDDTVGALRRALASADVEPSDLAAVLLVGGSSRIPLVGELVSRELGRPVAVDAHPKHAVALGAAVIAQQEGTVATVSPDPAVSVATPPPTPSAAESSQDAEEHDDGGADGGAGRDADEPAAGEPVAAGPTLPGGPPAAGSGDGNGSTEPGPRRRGPLLVGAAVGVLLVLGGLGFALLGGDSGGDDGDVETAARSETSEADEMDDTTTMATTTTLPEVEVGPSGRGVRIDDITVDDDGTYLVEYRTRGFEPLISDNSSYHHVHFFFDTVEPQNAGTNGPAPAEWILWDGPVPFDGYSVEDRPPDAEQMCALVADHRHGVELETGNCWALP